MKRKEMMERFELVKEDILEWKQLEVNIANLRYLIGQAKVEKNKVPAGGRFAAGFAAFLVSGGILLNLFPNMYPGYQVMGIVGATWVGMTLYSRRYRRSSSFAAKEEGLKKLKANLTEAEAKSLALSKRIGNVLCFIPETYLNPEAVENMYEKLCYQMSQDSWELIRMHQDDLAEQAEERRRQEAIAEEERESYIEAEYNDACARYYASFDC